MNALYLLHLCLIPSSAPHGCPLAIYRPGAMYISGGLPCSLKLIHPHLLYYRHDYKLEGIGKALDALHVLSVVKMGGVEISYEPSSILV